jgi:hypothetical protein
VADIFRLPFPVAIISAELSCETAAANAAIIVNATLNGTTIFSTKPQINVGATATSNTPVLSITSGNAGDVLRFFVDQASGGGRLLRLGITLRRA